MPGAPQHAANTAMYKARTMSDSSKSYITLLGIKHVASNVAVCSTALGVKHGSRMVDSD